MPGTSNKAVQRLNNLPILKTFRRKLRNKSTPAEVRLWSLLKGSQLDGKKFRRQHSFGYYILDFYCPSQKLAIELDGEYHNNVLVQIRDHERTLFLEHFGITVLRFENRLVFDQTKWVLEEISKNFSTRAFTTPPTLRRAPLL